MSDDIAHSFEKLVDKVAVVSGWGVGHCAITFVYDKGVSVCVAICGGKTTISAWGHDHCEALVALIQQIESHHREVARWHIARCNGARAVLDELGIYYVKVPVE